MNRVGLCAAMACAMGVAASAHAATATIDIFTFDLGQFSDASVTTNVSASHLHGSTFDNPAGIDLFTLGELATAQFGGDKGDRISLGDYSAQDTLTLNYGSNPFKVGAGQASFFVVYEQNGDSALDPEGQNFDISFDGGQTWIDAHDATLATLVTLPGATSQNQIAFDLTMFGYSIGDMISTVMLRNQIGVDEFDPDFLFAGQAGGGGVVVPLPTGAGTGLVGFSLLTLRRRRS